MSSKLLTTLAVFLSIALSGCGGAGLVAGLAANAEQNRYNNAIDAWNDSIPRVEAARSRASSALTAARSSRSQTAVDNARRANDVYLREAQASVAAAQRLQSVGEPNANQNLADAQRELRRAQDWQTELNSLGGSSGTRSGGGSSASGPRIYDVSRPPDLLLVTDNAFDVTSGGTITERDIDPDSATVESYTDRHGNQFRIALSGQPANGDGTYAWHFADGRPNPDYFSSRVTIHGVPLFIDTHDHSNNGETHRTLLAAGRYSAAAVTGHYDPASRRGGEDIYAVSYGDRAFSLPTISATYRGAMIGTELITRAALEGRASITYSSANNDLDIRLHGIRQYRDGEVTAGTYGGPAEFQWNDVPLDSQNNRDTLVVHYGENLRLHGSFYGPNGEEFGGTFETPSTNNGKVVGAFVAKK